MRRTILTLGIMLGAAVPASAQAARWLLPQAAAACDVAHGASKIVNREKGIQVPVLMLWRDDDKTPWTLARFAPEFAIRIQREYKKSVPSDYAPVRADQVRSVACVTRGGFVRMGEYAGGQKAYGYNVEFTILDWPIRKPVGKWTYKIEPPDFKKQSESNIATASPDLIGFWIARTLEYR